MKYEGKLLKYIRRLSEICGNRYDYFKVFWLWNSFLL